MFNQKKLRSSVRIEKNWTAYEKNQLLQHGFKLKEMEDLPEMPVEYITGFAPFMGFDYLVNSHVLIPRIETEGLVKMAFEFVTQYLFTQIKQNKVNVIDVGTGSGCIGISLYQQLQKFPIKTQVTLTDVSQQAIQIAQNNLELLLGKKSHADFQCIVCDLLTGLPKQKFDVIVANLPYIPNRNIKGLATNVLEHEPLLALKGGSSGLKFVKKLLKQASYFLKKDGLILLEIDERSILNRKTLNLEVSLWNYLVVKDDQAKQRYLLVGLHPRERLVKIARVLKNHYNETL